MADYDYDLGIIGGGAAGLTAASGAAQLGAKVILLEEEPRLGGDCLHYGCVPSKTLIKTASVRHLMQTASRFGLPPVDLPPVEFKLVAQRIRSVIARIEKHDSSERFCGLGARVEFGRAAFVDEHQVEADGKVYLAKNWLIATGSSPSAPPLPGLDSTAYLTNREIFSLDRLPASLLVLGGGPIACEMAQAFARLGSRVSLVQRSGQILSKEDQDMADVVMASMQQDGVEVHFNTKLKEVRDLGGAKEITFEDASGEEKKISGEALLVALGRKANVAGLNLEAAGVEYTPRGISVDPRMRTSQKHIYAAGDVTGRYQFTHAAGYEAGIVLSNAIFRVPRKADYTYLPWCTYTGPELASIGLNEKAAQKAGIAYEVWREEFADNDRSLAEGQSQGCLKLLLGEDEKSLGVQVVGLHAGELLNEWVAVFNGKVKFSTLAGAIHPYPTLGEINKRVAGEFMAQKLFSDKVKKGLKFFFSLKGRACRLEDE